MLHCGVFVRCIEGFVSWVCCVYPWRNDLRLIFINCDLLIQWWISVHSYLRPGQNVQHFADNIFLYLNFIVKFVPKGRFYNKQWTMVQIMACHWTGDKPLSQSMMVQFSESLGPEELTYCRADFRFAHNQWETSLQSNAVSHWLGANLESAMVLRKINVLTHAWWDSEYL